MSKLNKFKKGELVSAKKLNGEKILGIYQYEYDCGDHCISIGTKKYCVQKNPVKKATEEEEKIIQETIIKPMREAKKKAAEELRKAQEEQNSYEDELSEEDMETMASEENNEDIDNDI